MISSQRASEIAQSLVEHGQHIDAAHKRETREGWYFPYAPEYGLIGSSGVIVHKKTGKGLVLGSAFSVERDIDAFDAGFQFECYDLVVLEVFDENGTLDVLRSLSPSVVVPEYESGRVWRVPRKLSRSEIAHHIRRLPAVFPEIQLYFHVESLLEARDHGYFRFEALEFRAHS